MEAASHAGCMRLAVAAAFREGSKAPKLPVVRVSGLCIVPGLKVIGGMVRIHGSEKDGPCHVRGGGGHRGGLTQGRQQICGRPERVRHLV